jgi:signal transduction histidine kinase
VRYISHELRSPLNAISVGLYVLSQEMGKTVVTVSNSSPLANASGRVSGNNISRSASGEKRLSGASLGDRQSSQLARIRSGSNSSATGGEGDSAMCVLEDVLNSCESMVSILDDLLVFNQIENACFELKRERMEMASLLKDAISPFYVVVSHVEWINHMSMSFLPNLSRISSK